MCFNRIGSAIPVLPEHIEYTIDVGLLVICIYLETNFFITFGDHGKVQTRCKYSAIHQELDQLRCFSSIPNHEGNHRVVACNGLITVVFKTCLKAPGHRSQVLKDCRTSGTVQQLK